MTSKLSSRKTILKPAILIFTFILIIGAAIYISKNQTKIKSFGNEFEIGTVSEFKTGVELSNIEITDSIGDGAIELKKTNGNYPADGYYISQIIDVPAFEYMVASWNSDTPPGTYVEIEAKVLVSHYDKDNKPVQTWSEWLSWGKWSPFMERASANTYGDVARTSTDELLIRGSKGETANKIQLRANLHTDDPNLTPAIRYIHVTLKNTLKGQEIPKVFRDEVNIDNLNVNLDVPKISQMIRDPRTANSICSPTTITMMMNCMGEKLLPEEVAQNTCDFNFGFGNWSFAAATLGSYGYKAYVDYSNIEGLKQEIAKGYPVGASVTYSDKPGSSYPYLEGAPGETPGHLLVVTGFETIDGVEYILVNDPYAPENETVARKYKLEQFEKAWVKSAAYIIREKEENAGNYHTKRIEAQLVESDTPGEYQIIAGNEIINIENFDGSIAYTTDGDNIDFDQVSYKYPPISYKNSLDIDEEDLKNPNFKLYVITDTGYVYVANKQQQ